MSTVAKPAGQLSTQDGILPQDTNRSLPIALLRAREALMVRFRPLLAAHGLTEQQWRVLRVLQESGPLDASDLAVRACVLAPSLTRMIKSLEDRRFIKRTRDSQDGRRAQLSITSAGTDFIALVSPDSRAVYDEIRHRYGAERIEHLIDMLNELAATGAESLLNGKPRK